MRPVPVSGVSKGKVPSGVCPQIGGMAADASAIRNALHTIYID